MKKTFKTNINCGGCVAAVKPALDNAEGIIGWEVDTNNPAKILSVDAPTLSEEDIIALVQKAGYKAEPSHSR